jgi:hypothetical protein
MNAIISQISSGVEGDEAVAGNNKKSGGIM